MNKQTRIGDWVRRYNKQIFPLYSSFKGGAQGKMVNVDKRQNIFANPRLWVVAGLCVFGGIYGFRNLWKFFHPAPPPSEIANSADAGSPKGAAPGAGSAPVSDSILGHPALSSQWRIAGRYAHGPESWVLLVDSAGQVRMESPSVITGAGLLAVGVIDGQLVTPYSGGIATEFKGSK